MRLAGREYLREYLPSKLEMGLTKTALVLAIAFTSPLGAVTGISVQAMALFAGVSDIQISENPNGTVLIQFKADLPFQYQLNVLDENRIRITLMNARLASQLKEADGHLHVASSFALKHSRYQEGGLTKTEPLQEEIILEAPGLGARKLLVEGATQLVESEATERPTKQSDISSANISFEEEGLEVAPRLQRQVTPFVLATPYSSQAPSKLKSPVMSYRLGNSQQISPLSMASPNVLKLNPSVGQAQSYNALSLWEEKLPNEKIKTVRMLMQEALAYYRQHQLQQTLNTLNQALALEPRNGSLYAALGEVFLKENSLQKAQDAYQKATQLSDNPRYHYRYAIALLKNGEQLRAIQALEDLLKRNPTDATAHHLLGTLYQEVGQTALALSHLQRAEQLNPRSAEIHYTLGLTYELDGRRDLAKNHYTKAIQLNPVSHEAVQALERVRS